MENLLEKFNMSSAKAVPTPIESDTKITKDLGPADDEERQRMKNRLLHS